MQLNGARILIECLIREGVNIIFGYPGGSVLDIYDELPQYGEQLRHVLVRHEQAAVHAADGYARATGKVGVCMATSGPGATNTVTGIATAYCDSIPMVIFTGQVPTGLIGNDAFQEVDIAGITRPCTKHNYVVKDVKDLAKVVRQAFYLARSGRPGPVLVDLPKNVLQGSAEFVWPEDVSLRSYNPTYRPNYAQIRKVVDALYNAERPLLFGGGGVIMSNASEEFRNLAKNLSIPVTCSLMGLGAFPCDHPQWLGMLGMHGTYAANKAVSNADLLIAVGVRFDDRVTGRLSSFAPKATIVHIDIDPTSIHKNVNVRIPVVGDCRNSLIAIREHLAAREPLPWKERFAAPHGAGRFRRGVGIACGAHKNGIFSGSPDLSGMTLSMNEDGTVNLRTSVHDVGCGTVRSMQIILAEVLRMDPELIFVTEGDTKFTPYDCGTYGSRTTYVAGACAKETAEKFKKLLLETASKLLGVPAPGLELRDGRVAGEGVSPGGIGYREIATRAINELSTEMIVTNSYKSDSNPGSYAVNFAEAEVDTLTGLVRVTDFLSVNDIGQAINRQMVYNQISGGVQMAAGFALCEDLGINSKGVPTKDSLKKYNTLNAADMPAVKTILVEEGGDKGPFGAKSIGEISTVPGAAAIVNAVNNALGTAITELPLTPERIVEAFGRRGAASDADRI